MKAPLTSVVLVHVYDAAVAAAVENVIRVKVQRCYYVEYS